MIHVQTSVLVNVILTGVSELENGKFVLGEVIAKYVVFFLPG